MASIEDSLREKELQKAKDILAFCELEDGEYPISKEEAKELEYLKTNEMEQSSLENE
ncbi:hypothetical protein ACE66E_001740 [Campylobacter jejuni]|uniref:Uncharacterized protein n=1 Tax=Campylobacter jejuni subsp. jejuni serotype O:23/36 (strain 81-176) TaxID=354242 RepID=Q8GJE6_CAMJJ|nr:MULTISPECIES: hypothetical protein [Campylobacter]ETJ81719.1 hypothetical protein X908_08005 [Campylobacter jejuni subsp. jejuni 81-176-DRH212]ETN89805.1 hypothetical protein X910_08920 [Campylobacter jejuni subsp. jejuni 81-176-UMCW9]AAN46902.1 unknown [Campylobacter jejuni subsp. jejuni 81-176]ADC29276.1 hypothetical protein CJSA_pVir0008 [Campylobacter jejuni subsp. jejuni IA3902]AHK74255.1 hypothetical protein YSQ_10015 [Campylobacter coli RM1875]